MANIIKKRKRMVDVVSSSDFDTIKVLECGPIKPVKVPRLRLNILAHQNSKKNLRRYSEKRYRKIFDSTELKILKPDVARLFFKAVDNLGIVQH